MAKKKIRKINTKAVKIVLPRRPAVILDNIAWAKKGKDADC